MRQKPMRPDPVLSLLSLAQKAGFVKSGEFMAESAVREERAFLCIVAQDASDNTKKKFRDMCSYHKVCMTEYSDKETLGHAIGKEMRAILCVSDEKLALKIRDKIPGVSQIGKGSSD